MTRTDDDRLQPSDLPFLDAAARYLADPASLKLARQSERDKAIAAVRRAHAWAQRGLARQQEGKR